MNARARASLPYLVAHSVASLFATGSWCWLAIVLAAVFTP